VPKAGAVPEAIYDAAKRYDVKVLEVVVK
jgi:hypothetical protein